MPNVLSAPRQWAKKVVLIKSEATLGTDPTPTGAANWIEARNVQLTPLEADRGERNLVLPALGNSGSILAGTWCRLDFEVALVGPGTAGTAPKVAPLWLASGFSETLSAGVSVAYNLVSLAFGSLTAYIYIDGVLHKMSGCRANLSVALAESAAPMLKVSLQSVYVAPTTQALPAIDRTGWQIEEAVNATNTLPLTLNGVALAMTALDLDVGNELQRFNLPGPQTGIEISNRKPTGTLTVLAPPLASFDPFALATAGTIVTLTTTHGSAAGKKIKIDAKTQVTGVAYTEVRGLTAYQLTLMPMQVAGNDELAFTYL